MKNYCVTIWDRKAAYGLNEKFESDDAAIKFAKSRANRSTNVRLYSCEKKCEIYSHYV